MRQIFSVVFAAALVFGGALYLAGLSRVVDPDNDGSIWNCPEIEVLQSGAPPEGFFVQRGSLSSLTHDFGWRMVTLHSKTNDYRSDVIHAEHLKCQYVRLLVPDEVLGPTDYFELRLRPGLRVEIRFDDFGKRNWENISGRSKNATTICVKSAAACHFRVFAVE